MKLTHRRCGDYYLPNIGIPVEDMQPLGKYGRMRLRYLQEHQFLLLHYTNHYSEPYVHLLAAIIQEK